MQKVLIFIFKFLTIIVQGAVVLLVSSFILFVAFIIDPKFYENFNGNDVMSAFNYVSWLNQTFPNVFFWYPIQGAGVSFTSGYQWLSHILAVFIHQTTLLPLSVSFASLRSVAFPLSAIGIVLLAWTRLEYPKQGYTRILIGLIAGFFFLVTPLTWYWTHKWGFYAEGVSYMFIAPALIFADWYIELEFKNNQTWKKRIALILAGLFWSFGFLTHFYTGTGIAHFILIMIASSTVWKMFKKDSSLQVAISEEEQDTEELLAVSKKKQKSRKFLQIKSALFLGIKSGLSLILIFLLFSGWRLFSYLDYSKQVAKGGFAGDIFSAQNAKDLNKPSLGQITQLEFISFPDARFIFDGYSVPLTIWLFALVSLIFSWTRSKKIWTMSLTVLYGFFSYSVTSVINTTYLLGPFAQIINFRSVWTVYRILLPLVAAYGIFLIPDLLLWLPDFLLRKISKYTGFVSSHILKPLIIIPAMVIILFFAINSIELNKNIFGYQLKSYSSTINYLKTPNIFVLTAGRRNIDSRDIWRIRDENYDLLKDTDPFLARIDITELKKFCQNNHEYSVEFQPFCQALEKGNDPDRPLLETLNNHCNSLNSAMQSNSAPWCINFNRPFKEQLYPQNWPQIALEETNQVTEKEKEEFAHLPKNPLQSRYDLSGLSGSILMRSPLITPLSTTQVYINQLSLNSALWNYQSSVMYSDQPIYQKPGILTELAQYFGYQYINATTNSPNATALYDNDPNWKKIDKGDWREFTKPTSLTTWGNNPKVLFISDQSKFTYDQFFKLANIGVLPYQKGILYNGKSLVENHTLEELKQFNLLILSGYKYKNAAKAHDLIDQYIKQGGSVFIDTGWQYQNDDSQILTNVPEFFPTNKLEWKDPSKNATLTIDDTSKLNYQPTQKDLGILSLTGAKWGVSTASDTRSDSSVLLYTEGNPVMIARNYQKGKLVWSGINIIPHIEGAKNQNAGEIELFAKALNWLLPNCPSDNSTENLCESESYPIQIDRPNPDLIHFKLNKTTDKKTTFYWRESFHPKWHATLKNNNHNYDLDIYRAGPRMTGVVLPPVQDGATVTLEVRNSFFDNAIYLLTIFGILSLPLYIINLHLPILNKIVNFKKNEKKHNPISS